MATPLTDSINALTTYANEVTGASDTTLSDAVYTLASGYGQGGGASITDGTEVLVRNASGYPTSIKHYGTKVYPQQYWNRIASDGGWKALASVTFNDVVTELMMNAFGFCGALTSIDVSSLTTLGQQALQGCTSLTTLSFPALTTIKQYALSACTGLTTVSMPLLTNYNQQRIFNGCTGLTNVQMGSVGHTVTIVHNQAFYNCTQTGLTITLYTTGSYVDTLVSNTRTGATNATIVIKASEATTYGGNSYAAGATMLTA